MNKVVFLGVSWSLVGVHLGFIKGSMWILWSLVWV